MITNYGLKLDEIEITESDYQFGALARDVIQPDGNWEEYLPVYEKQAELYETSGCTSWGSLNQVECYMKKVFGFEPNYSDRFTYINARITLNGAPPSRAYESIRKQGVIDESLLPTSKKYDGDLAPATYQDFIQPNPMLKGFLDQGKKWVSQYSFKHEWVDSQYIEHALMYSPVAISVSAWIEEDGVYVSKFSNNHWCIAYKVEDGHIWAFDSYDSSKKKLSKDHDIKYAKRIQITKIDKPLQKKLSIWDFINLFRIYKIGKYANK